MTEYQIQVLFVQCHRPSGTDLSRNPPVADIPGVIRPGGVWDDILYTSTNHHNIQIGKEGNRIHLAGYSLQKLVVVLDAVGKYDRSTGRRERLINDRIRNTSIVTSIGISGGGNL